ncbi:hypothetical protein ACFQH9_25500 [Pseudonocardia lutea]|uniref:Uncharacterized protein n=1 Tax=Pseudonocardia lutea TaxID=2172015 RepID=A0ABW1IG32_9PSEU
MNGAELEVAVEGAGETIVDVHGAGIADSSLPVRRRGRGSGDPRPLVVVVAAQVRW